MRRTRAGIAVLLTGALSVMGLGGCTPDPPLTPQQEEQQAQSIGNFIFLVIYKALCDANYGVCPFPLGPSDPPAGP